MDQIPGSEGGVEWNEIVGLCVTPTKRLPADDDPISVDSAAAPAVACAAVCRYRRDVAPSVTLMLPDGRGDEIGECIGADHLGLLVSYLIERQKLGVPVVTWGGASLDYRALCENLDAEALRALAWRSCLGHTDIAYHLRCQAGTAPADLYQVVPWEGYDRDEWLLYATQNTRRTLSREVREVLWSGAEETRRAWRLGTDFGVTAGGTSGRKLVLDDTVRRAVTVAALYAHLAARGEMTWFSWADGALAPGSGRRTWRPQGGLSSEPVLNVRRSLALASGANSNAGRGSLSWAGPLWWAGRFGHDLDALSVSVAEAPAGRAG